MEDILAERRKLYDKTEKRLAKFNKRMISGEVLSTAELAELENLQIRSRALRAGLNYRETPEDHRASKTAEDQSFSCYLRTGFVDEIMSKRMAEYRADGVGFTTAPNDAGLSAGPPGPAGYVIPQGFWQNLQIALKAYGGISNDFKVVRSETGAPMPWPVLDPTLITASVLGGELIQLNPANPYVIGQGMLNCWTLAVDPVLVSLQLVNDSAFDVDEMLSRLLGEALGREIAALAVSGSGSGQPEGIITALNARGAVSTSGGYYGLTAATKVAVLGNYSSPSLTELVGNVLSPMTMISMIQNVDAAYYPGAKWYLSAPQAFAMRSITDGQGRPLLSLLNGFNSDNLNDANYNSNSPVGQVFGFPVVIDNNIPALTANTTGGPIFGDLSKAMVYREVANGASVMRLSERYADYLAVGFLGWLRTEMRSNDLRAAITVKCAAT